MHGTERVTYLFKHSRNCIERELGDKLDTFFSEPMAQSMLNPVCLDSLGTALRLSAANKTIAMIY